MKPEMRTVISMGLIYITTGMLALLITPLFRRAGMKAFENEESIWNPVCYIILILLFTLFILYIIKRGKEKIIRYIMIFAICVTLAYVIYPFVSTAFPGESAKWSILCSEPCRKAVMVDLDGDGNDEIVALTEEGVVIRRASGIIMSLTVNGTDLIPVHMGDITYVLVPGSPAILLNTTRTSTFENGTWLSGSAGDINGDGSDEIVLVNATGAFLLSLSGDQLSFYPGRFKATAILPDLIILSGRNLTAVFSMNSSSPLSTFNQSFDFLCPFEGGLLGASGVDLLAFDSSLNVIDSWSFDHNITGLYVRDIWSDPHPEVGVRVGGDAVILHGKGLKHRLDLSSVLGTVGVSGGIALGDWDVSDHLVQAVVYDEGGIRYVSIDTSSPTFLDMLTYLLAPQYLISLALAVSLTYILIRYPEWYVVDGVGVMVAAGVASIFGISFAVVPAIILLMGLAIYDFYAVYRSKHMIDLADAAISMHLPLLVVVPKEKGYSFRKERSIKQKIERGEEREAMFMGLGDLIIPSILVVSSYRFLDTNPAVMGLSGNLFVAISTLAGILMGYACLSIFVLKGRPQAGLPFLNTGAIAGFLISSTAIYGILPL